MKQISISWLDCCLQEVYIVISDSSNMHMQLYSEET